MQLELISLDGSVDVHVGNSSISTNISSHSYAGRNAMQISETLSLEYAHFILRYTFRIVKYLKSNGLTEKMLHSHIFLVFAL